MEKWIVPRDKSTVTIPPGQLIGVEVDDSGVFRVFWAGLVKKGLGFSVAVTEEDLRAHAHRLPL